jgi:hypothetical protein
LFVWATTCSIKLRARAKFVASQADTQGESELSFQCLSASCIRSFNSEIRIMLKRRAAFLLLLFVATTARASDVKRLVVSDLSPGSHFELVTTDHVYRGQCVDPTTGETRLAASSDGVQFGNPHTVFLLGATQGPQTEAGGLMLVKMNQVQTGMRLELGVGSLGQENRRITEKVNSIRVE